MNTQPDAAANDQAAIEHDFPALSVNSLAFIGEGMDSQAFLVNDGLIFRFPKYASVNDQLQVEILLLPHLQSHLPVAIPHFQYVGTQVNNGFSFVGYKKIPGSFLKKESLNDSLIRELVAFFTALHEFPLASAQDCGVKTQDFRETYTTALEQLRNDAYHLLNDVEIKYIEQLFEEYLSDENNFKYTPALLHADISPDHVLYDEEKNTLTGIIDFGDVMIGDPDYDLMFPYEDYGGADFIHALLNYYPHPDPERLIKKLDFFTRCNTVRDILLGLQRKDEKIVQWALEDFRKKVSF